MHRSALLARSENVWMDERASMRARARSQKVESSTRATKKKKKTIVSDRRAGFSTGRRGSAPTYVE